MIWGCVAIALLFSGLHNNDSTMLLTSAAFALSSSIIISKCYLTGSSKKDKKEVITN